MIHRLLIISLLVSVSDGVIGNPTTQLVRDVARNNESTHYYRWVCDLYKFTAPPSCAVTAMYAFCRISAEIDFATYFINRISSHYPSKCKKKTPYSFHTDRVCCRVPTVKPPRKAVVKVGGGGNKGTTYLNLHRSSLP